MSFFVVVFFPPAKDHTFVAKIFQPSMTGNRQKPSQTKALLSKNDKADKSPPVKMTGQTKALPLK
jgi:hypothetical protein